MKIKISNLKDGVHDLSFSGKVEEAGLEEPFFDNYYLGLNIDKSAHQVMLKGDLKLKAKLDCDRCSEEFIKEVNPDFTMVYLFERPSQDMEEDEESVVYLPPDTDKIDISRELYDYSYLALPFKKLCKEECKGLCPNCGTNQNEKSCDCETDTIDPRWLPLLEAKKKLDIN